MTPPFNKIRGVRGGGGLSQGPKAAAASAMMQSFTASGSRRDCPGLRNPVKTLPGEVRLRSSGVTKIRSRHSRGKQFPARSRDRSRGHGSES